jgi:PAS domain S-box-containing protein/putative nucleotidyltransferase with HDIG domain
LADRAVSASRRDILIIDSDANSAALIARTLRGAGYHIGIASDGESGLAKAFAAAPDMVLVAADEHPLDGYEVCRRLKADERTASALVIVLGDEGSAREMVRAFEAGAVDCLFKPVDQAELLTRVRTHLTLHALKLDTPQRQLLAALDDTEEHLRRTVIAAPFPIMLHAEDGEVLVVNDEWVKLTGYSLADIPTIRAWTERAYGPKADVVREEVEAFFRSGSQKADGEYTIRAADGELRVWDFSSALLSETADGRRVAISTARDITDRRAAEAAAAANAERLQAVLDNAPFGAHMYELTDDDGLVFVGYNRKAEEMLGIDHEALLGLTLEEAFPGNADTDTPAQYRRVAREGATWEMDQYAYDAEGIAGVFEVLAFPFGPNRATVFFRDITEKRKLEIALEESEIRYKRLFESMQEGFGYLRMVRDSHGDPADFIFLDVSGSFETLSGLSNAIGRGLMELLPGLREASPQFLEAAAGVVSGGGPEQFELSGRMGRWLRFSMSSPEPDHLVVIAEDIDDRRRAEDALLGSSRALRALSGVNEALVRAQSEAELLATVCDTITVEAGYALAWVGYAEQGEDQPVRVVQSSGASANYVTNLKVSWGSGPRGQGPAGRCIRSVSPIVQRDLDSDPSFAPWRDDAMRAGFKSSVTMPLVAPDGSAFGVLCIYSDDPDAYDADEIALLAEMAEDLSYGLEALKQRTRRLEIELDLLSSNERLEGLLRSIIETMGKIVETRDPYTQGHELRVARLGKLIAEEMGLSEAEAEGIEIAGLVHDIGKLSVPAEILNKPGRLSPTEFALIEEHSRSGYEILRDIDFGWPVAETVLQHHERLDGSGYPGGLVAGELSQSARILAVADVVEAMASHRPYRPSLGFEEAFAEVSSHPEKYDAEVVAACGRLHDQGSIGFLSEVASPRAGG